MGALPAEIVRALRILEDVFRARGWDWVRVLVVGAILTPGRRTVAAVLRAMGLSEERQFQNYHRVLNRARWSSRALSRRLLRALVAAFVPVDGLLVVGLHETIVRRRFSSPPVVPIAERRPYSKWRRPSKAGWRAE
jgi:DDE superfamily endonuclease